MIRILRTLLPLLITTAALAESADIRLVPQTQQPGSNRFSIIFALYNNGPDVARNTVLTIDVPANATIDKLSVGTGDTFSPCDASQRPIRCQIGEMHVGQPPYYGGFEVRTPLANASYSATLSVTSETPDPNSADNAATLNWMTAVEADLQLLVVPQTDRVDPGGTGNFLANVCNGIRDNRPPTVRVEFTPANGTLTSFTPASGFTCNNDGPKVVCTIAELPPDCPLQPFKFSIRASDDRRGGEARVTAVATSDIGERNPENNVDSKVIPIYRWLTVSTTADAGAGSLRQAITDANAGCTPGPCRIVFEIPGPVPSEGWFTITPSEPLPSITADRVTLEGSRQTAFTGNTNGKGPEIAIDGRLAHRGIRMLARCEAVVDGLAIGNFDEDQGLWVSAGAYCGNRPDRHEVLLNHIGTDPTGDVPWPNLRGLRADFAAPLTVKQNVIAHNTFSGIWLWRGAIGVSSNYIADNGASGIFLGPEVFSAAVNDNVIRNHPQMGIAVARTATVVQMRRNAMQNNGGLGIDWGLDGVSPADGDDSEGVTNAPTLLSATYDAASNKTTVALAIKSSKIGPYFNYGYLDFYSNAGPDGDGETFVMSSSNTTFNGTFTVTIPANLRGQWLNATFTREHLYGSGTPPIHTEAQSPGYNISTSELSNAVLVQ